MDQLTEKVQKARNLAKKFHENQFRITGEEYIMHVERVVKILIDYGVNDENVLAAAYVHHALVASDQNEQIILKELGPEVLEIVKEFKKLSAGSISSIDPSNINEKYIIQAYINIASNPKTLLIRLADKVDNIKSVYALPRAKAQKVALRALYIYAPICKLLGLPGFSRVLENEAFKTLDPADYYEIKEFLYEKTPELTKNFNEIKKFICEILDEKGIRARVDYRTKSVYSIYKKLQKYNKTVQEGLNDIHDLAAMRVRVDTLENCFAVEGILKQIWDEIPDERQDYITRPKPSGYKSIHNIFKVSDHLNCEIQIKTFDMHEDNEYGTASHTFYKIGENLREKLKTDPQFLRDISFVQNKEEIKLSHFANNVYVFTPKGRIIELPRGSNLIDLAYAIHHEVGNSCAFGIVNDDFQKLTYELQDGDRVEIKTVPNKKMPNPEWVDLVKTKRAKEAIKKALREIRQF